MTCMCLFVQKYWMLKSQMQKGILCRGRALKPGISNIPFCKCFGICKNGEAVEEPPEGFKAPEIVFEH